MATREFNGSSDYITLGGTGVQLANGPRSCVALIKPLVLATGGEYLNFAKTTSTRDLLGMADGASSGYLGYNSYVDGVTGIAADCTATDWQVLGLSRATGVVVARAHRKALGSGIWTHNDSATTTGANDTDAWTITEVGRRGGATNYKNFRIAVAAVFDTQLADADFEGIESAASTAAIAALGPLALWDFNQASTATTIEDLIGSADQTAISGTTAVADDPAWTFGIGQGSVGNIAFLSGVGW